MKQHGLVFCPHPCRYYREWEAEEHSSAKVDCSCSEYLPDGTECGRECAGFERKEVRACRNLSRHS